MRGKNRAVWKQGENIAARFLSRRGYEILGRNIRTFVGEIDIVARKGSSIVFVEVKARKSKVYGPPYLAVTEKKKKKLISCGLCYLKMKNMHDTPWQIDVISIEFETIFRFMTRVKLEHFKDAVEDISPF